MAEVESASLSDAVVRTIREPLPILDSLRLVVLTTSEAERDVLDAYENRADADIVPPVDFEQLFRTVQLLEDFWLTVVRLPKG